MNRAVSDITPQERRLLSRLCHCPALFLGEPSLRNFAQMSGGYQYAMQTVGLRQEHNLLPDGLDKFTDRWYGGGMGTRNCFSMIALQEPDDARALDRFFEMLDAYLAELGYDPIPAWEGDIQQTSVTP